LGEREGVEGRKEMEGDGGLRELVKYEVDIWGDGVCPAADDACNCWLADS
jgi:hypothetical protein